MGIKIKNLQTGEFEKFNIPALKGEKGEPGEIEPSEKVDYIGKQHSKLRDTMNANVDYIIKTAIGEFNYLDYEGQHITATNSIEGHAKSAILSGNTLVNTLIYKHTSLLSGATRSDDTITLDKSQQWSRIHLLPSNPLWIPNETYTTILYDVVGDTSTLHMCSQNGGVATKTPFTNNKAVFTMGRGRDTNNDNRLGYIESTTIIANETVSFKVVILKGDYSDVDVPYFEGMASCKMPILHTVGKNLFDGKLQRGYLQDATGTPTGNKGLHGTTYIPCKPNTTYVISGTLDGVTPRFYFYDREKNYLGYESGQSPYRLFTSRSNSSFMRIRLFSNEVLDINQYGQIQIEESTQETFYEEHKTSILSLPEEVVLRSLPNGVCDTFNMRTGVYTQRIGEIVLEGESVQFLTDPISNDGLYQSYYTKNNFIENIKGSSHTLSDKLPTKHPFSWLTPNMECVGSNFPGLNISLKLSTLNVTSEDSSNTKLEKLYSYLQLNPIIVQYELANPIIKTVDLSDNHVYSYKGTTHYDCSSEEGSLVPTLSVKVPTDTQLTIQEQKATTQTLLIKNMDLQQSIKEVQAMNLAFNTALYNSFNSIREEVEDIKKYVSTNENLEGSF